MKWKGNISTPLPEDELPLPPKFFQVPWRHGCAKVMLWFYHLNNVMECGLWNTLVSMKTIMYCWHHIKLRLIKVSHTTLFTWKEKGREIGGRESCFLLKISVIQKCSVFSGSSLFLCGFDPQAFSEQKKRKVWPNLPVPLLVRDTELGRVRRHYWDAAVKRNIAVPGSRSRAPAVLRSLALSSLCARLRSMLLLRLLKSWRKSRKGQ